LAALIICVGFSIKIASAQVSISIYPVSFRIALNPGETYTGSVTVVNPNNFDLGVRPEKENISGGAEGEVQLLGNEETKYGLASWIYFNETEMVLKPQERREISFVISVPLNAQPGGHYAAILFRGLGPDQLGESTSGVGVSGRVGTTVLVEVAGDVQKSGEITSLDASKFISHGPLEISFKVKNTGNTHFSPEGKIIVSGLFQKKELNWEPRVVFPGYDRTFKVNWDNKYFFGPIKITLAANIPGAETLKEMSITVWAFPWQEFLILVATVVLIWLIVRTFKKKFKIIKVGP